MIGGISAGDGFVMRLGNDLVAAHYDRANWHLVLGSGEPGLRERRIHSDVTAHGSRRTAHVRRTPFKHAPALLPSQSSTSFRLWIGRRARDRPRRTAPRVPIPRAGSATVAGSRASRAALHTRGRSPRRRAAASPPA